MSKLDHGQQHILRLALKEADAEGWAKVSEAIWPFISAMPDELVELKPDEVGGFVRVTPEGKAVLQYA